MNQCKYIFYQIASFLPARIFDRRVHSHAGDKWIKHFACWNQLLCMMFGRLSSCDSLRDLLVCITAHKPKHYHLGFEKIYRDPILQRPTKSVTAESSKCLLMRCSLKRKR